MSKSKKSSAKSDRAETIAKNKAALAAFARMRTSFVKSVKQAVIECDKTQLAIVVAAKKAAVALWELGDQFAKAGYYDGSKAVKTAIWDALGENFVRVQANKDNSGWATSARRQCEKAIKVRSLHPTVEGLDKLTVAQAMGELVRPATTTVGADKLAQLKADAEAYHAAKAEKRDSESDSDSDTATTEDKVRAAVETILRASWGKTDAAKRKLTPTEAAKIEAVVKSLKKATLDKVLDKITLLVQGIFQTSSNAEVKEVLEATMPEEVKPAA